MNGYWTDLCFAGSQLKTQSESGHEVSQSILSTRRKERSEERKKIGFYVFRDSKRLKQSASSRRRQTMKFETHQFVFVFLCLCVCLCVFREIEKVLMFHHTVEDWIQVQMECIKISWKVYDKI